MASHHSEPDELYTLRAQYCLGHYQMAIEEAKSVARRPMSPALKAEREEFLARALIATGQYAKVTGMQDTPALQVLSLKAQYEAAANTPGNEDTMERIVDQIKTIAASVHDNTTPSVHVYAASVLLAAGQTKEALMLVHTGSSMEQIALCLQIYLKMDRLDLAQQQFALLKQGDEDAVLTQLGHVHVALATGATGAADALHTVNQLSEQYGSSPLLLNLQAAALMLQGDFATAESKLQECLRDYSDVAVIPDTLINLIVCTVHSNNANVAVTNKMATIQTYVGQIQQQFPSHPFLAGLDRVTSAFDREAIKYKV